MYTPLSFYYFLLLTLSPFLLGMCFADKMEL